jgi:alkanesulfonate monooxygenase SsuD/methylene tetrahydromethanopterin reductase-like flavin-dependent oxidoreductase (luciferase family)
VLEDGTVEVGLGLLFQNLDGAYTDAEVYKHELKMAAQAEEFGFDSVWTPEHHFTGYIMTPNVPQFLSWVAAKTKRIKLGTTVTVLPWQDPVRTAEAFILLDHLSEGRAILGIGRGLGKVEFDGFGVNMSESRQRFQEYAEAVLTALETGTMEYDGTYLKQSRVELRPRPYKSFRGRVYASAISPESVALMANLDVGIMIIAQKPWDKVAEDLEGYRTNFLRLNKRPATRPIFSVFVGVSEDPAEAQDIRAKYLQAYARSSSDHYEFGNTAFATIEGYEYYGALARNIERNGINKFNGFLADLQVWGTPDEVTAKLQAMIDRFGIGGFVVYLQFGGMPYEVGQKNFELFAHKVLPRLHAIDVKLSDPMPPAELASVA